MAIEIVPLSAPTEDAVLLLRELDAELNALYISAQQHNLSLDQVFQPHIRFFLAQLNGKAAGCGGVALFSDFAEVKRMYVREPLRGQGVADAVMEQLVGETQKAGLSLLRLETGIHSHAAIRFYARQHFRERDAFEPYASLTPYSIATSRFFERQVTS
jgi:GNAT superfamily N-acetyltransferase